VGGAKILKGSKLTSKNELTQFLELLNPALAAPMFRGVAVQFQNSRPNCDKRRVLIFGDSFSEYRPHLLTGLLAETFQSVMFVWSAAIDYKIVESFRADIVLTEMAERFMKTLPDDNFDNQAFVLDRITNFLNLRCGNGRQPFIWSRTAEEGE
jgi:alginate O-acetyltransferase complex protein AlgJ